MQAIENSTALSDLLRSDYHVIDLEKFPTEQQIIGYFVACSSTEPNSSQVIQS